MRLRAILPLLAILLPAADAIGGAAGPSSEASRTALLPPPIPWSGKSRALVVRANDPWITPAERSGFRTTPRYDETVAWLQRLVGASPQLRMVSLGKSPEGRDIWMVIASKERKFTPEELRLTGKPIVFAQGAIHAGEMDGKDAGMMLLRDMTVRGNRRSLLDRASFLFVPIFNVDGHERFSAYTRINQRGPEQSGFRTTSRNLNLNRDYMKVDTPEMAAMIRALDRWDPHLYLDLHVTDGADYQYDVSFAHNGPTGYSPSIAGWIDEVLLPALTRDLRAAGHIPGPFIWFVDDQDPLKGIQQGLADPRFSTGYADVRHIPTLLVETHSLKPYDQRVLGTYIAMESALRTVAGASAGLENAIRQDRVRRARELPVVWKISDQAPASIELLGVEQQAVSSVVTGSTFLEYTGKPVTLTVPVVATTTVSASVSRPRFYWIPPAWTEVIDRLRIHGISMQRMSEPHEVEVEMLRLNNPEFEKEPFEGHLRVKATPSMETRRERFPTGSVRVSTDQPLGDLAVLLLEPASPDSFFQWGFFYEVLQRSEYVESYVMAPMAEKMLAEDPALAAEFEQKLAQDEAFRSSSTARLQWFYSRTPFFDDRWRLYPIGRER